MTAPPNYSCPAQSKPSVQVPAGFYPRGPDGPEHIQDLESGWVKISPQAWGHVKCVVAHYDQLPRELTQNTATIYASQAELVNRQLQKKDADTVVAVAEAKIAGTSPWVWAGIGVGGAVLGAFTTWLIMRQIKEGGPVMTGQPLLTF